MRARFLPPGNLLEDFDGDQLLLGEWSGEVNCLLQSEIRGLRDQGDVQLFNPLRDPRDDLQPRRVPWIAIPAKSANQRKRRDALEEADTPPANARREAQPEYVEWFTFRDQHGVTGVDVTTELPEYWDFLARTSPEKVLELYRRHVSPAVTMADLFDGTTYNQTNRFNSSQGVMHMTCSINTLELAIGVVAAATVWRRRNGEVVDLQDCKHGKATENADPALQTNVNRLAREQRAITFANPPGIYIFGIDLDGWQRPGGAPVTLDDIIVESRGEPWVRLRIEGIGFPLWQSTIDGEPIEFGSQIAERIIVGAVLAAGPREQRNPVGQKCEEPAPEGRSA